MWENDSFYTKTQEPYSFLLNRREWEAKRLRILARDNDTCQCCGKKNGSEVRLQVHHMHYIYGLDPWEYKDSELVTLCEECHSAYHSRNEVPVYRLEGGNLLQVNYTPCRRCGGAGWFPEYRHVQGGICFRCLGAKYDEYISVVKNYAEEHDIDIEDLKDGFQVLDKENTKLGAIETVTVCKCRNKSGVYLQLQMSSGKTAISCLDYSIKASPGDRLDPDKLKYKIAAKKSGELFMIIKGPLLRATA